MIARFGICCLLLITGLCSNANATVLKPSQYSMPNGESGSFLYRDDGCGAAGLANLAPITCATGDLVDDQIAAVSWNSAPAAYVGWFNVDPVISFQFASVVEIDSITLFFDDPVNNFGGVNQPVSATIAGSSFLIPDKGSQGPDSHTFGGLGFMGDEIDLQLFRDGRNFIMLSEVVFEGASAVPAPAPFALLALGLAFLAGRRRTA